MSAAFDLVVIGSGPAGQKAAIQAAKLGKRVAVVEREKHGRRRLRQHRDDPLEDDPRGRPLPHRPEPARRVRPELPAQGRHHDRRPRPRGPRTSSSSEVDVIRDQLARNRVELLDGTARFVDAAHGRASTSDDGGERRLDGRAHRASPSGRRRARPRRRRLRRPDDPRLRRDPRTSTGFPRSLVVVGAGVIGIEYASMFAALGTQVTVVERHARLLEFCDMRARRGAPVPPARAGRRLPLRRGGDRRSSARARRGDRARERQAASRRRRPLLRRAAGARPTARRSSTSASRPTSAAGSRSTTGYRTTVAAHLRGRRRDRLPEPRRDLGRAGPARGAPRVRRRRRSRSIDLLPVGIYTIPEISYVGRTEEELTEERDPVRGRDRALPRARARPDHRRPHGMLKLLVRRTTARCSASTSSAPARPSSSTSARP